MIQKYWPIIFLFTLWFGFASPYFLQHKVPYPSTYQVDFFSPWSRYDGYDAPVKNNAMPDVITQIYPWKNFTIEQLKQGSFPFWNPYSFSGTPHMANYQSAVFSPFTLLYFILPFIDAWSIIVLLQPLLAGLFLYFYLRQVQTSKIGSLLGSIAFMFSGFMVVWMAYGTLAMAIVFLPLLLFLIEKYFEKKSQLVLLGISIITAFSYFSGHFQTTIYVTGVTLLYILYTAYRLKDRKSGIITLVFIFTGILLAMPQIIPTFEFYKNSIRDTAYNSGAGIPYYNFITAIAPDFFGNPVTRNNKFLDFAEWQCFIGSIPLLLATFAFFKKKSRALFFVCIALVSAILAIASPLQELVSMLRIPVISTSVQSRIIVLFSFSIAVLAGFGYDALYIRIKEKQYRSIYFRIGFFGVLFVGIWGILVGGNQLIAIERSIAQKNLLLPTGLVFVASFGILSSLFIKKRVFGFLIGGMFLLLVSFDSFRFAHKWMPFDPSSLVFPPTKVTSYLQETIGNQRVFGNLGGQTEIYYGLSSLEGYDSLYNSAYGEFIASAPTGSLADPVNRVVSLSRTDKNTDKILNLLGVSFVFHPIADTNATWAYPVWKKQWMKPVYSDSSYTLYKNTNALPHAKMFYTYEVIADKQKRIKRFYSPSFDYKNTLLLEEKISLVQSAKNEKNSVKITSYMPNNVTIAVQTEKPGMLFLSDAYYPGWEAYLDGKKTKIYRADYAFRAVEMPAGAHTLVFTYVPWSFYTGCMLAVIGVLCMLIISFYLRTPPRKSKAMQGT